MAPTLNSSFCTRLIATWEILFVLGVQIDTHTHKMGGLQGDVAQVVFVVGGIWLVCAIVHQLIHWVYGDAYEGWLTRHGVAINWSGFTWYTEMPTWLGRLSRALSRFWGPWFTAGSLFALVGMAIGTIGLVGHLVWLLRMSVAERATSTPVLVPVIPGVNVPLTDMFYYVFAILIATAVHEAGHALAALSNRCVVDGVGLASFLVLPAAFTDVRRQDLELSTRAVRLRVLGAGAWHNIALCVFVLLLILCMPLLLWPLYGSGSGMLVVRSSCAVPQGSIVVSLNDCPVQNAGDWSACFSSLVSADRQAFCVSSSALKEAQVDHECCEQHYNGPMQCFHQRSNMYCMVASAIVGSSRTCNITHSCAVGTVCVDAAMSTLEARLLWVRLADGSLVVMRGAAGWLWYSLTLSPMVPRLHLPFLVGFDLQLLRLLHYIVSLSGALGLLNLLPVHQLDGSHILDVLMDGRVDYNVRHWIKTIATALLVLNVMLSMLSGHMRR
jgi:S2P endopeptidase